MREQQRADRFDQPFALLLLTMNAPVDPKTSAAVIEVLASIERGSDVLGWAEQDSVLGLMLTEVDGLDQSSPALEARVRRELARRVNAEAMSGCSIKLHVCPGPHTTSKNGIGNDLLLPSVSTNIRRSPLCDATKRTVDVAGSLVLMALLAPVFLAAAILVKLTSRGPVLFRQRRIGEGGRPFVMLKFRTMKTKADESIHREYVTQFITSNVPAPDADSQPVFKIVNDPRVTSVGRFLRRTSLDELPQFWNVLRGDMSLVGPRPALAYEVDRYQRWHFRRVLEARPGITGLWQVTGRSRTTFDEMVRLDLQYARTRSLWTDIKILLATPRAVLSGKGAA